MTAESPRAQSVRQPCANLIADDVKTIEVRSWTRDHPGKLVICAGLRAETKKWLSGSASSRAKWLSVTWSCISGKFPIPTCLVVSKDIHVTVIGVDFEPALRWREPAIDHSAYAEPTFPEPEGERLLVAAIASVALYANRHTVTIPL